MIWEWGSVGRESLLTCYSSLQSYPLSRARENMQFEKEIINSKKKRDFVQNHSFYVKKRYLLQK